jgi:hypothetical protein
VAASKPTVKKTAVPRRRMVFLFMVPPYDCQKVARWGAVLARW